MPIGEPFPAATLSGHKLPSQLPSCPRPLLMWIIRKFIAEMNPIEAMNTIRDRLVQTHSNEEFLLSMNG